MRYFVLPLLLGGLCWGQAADACKPSSLNIPGAPYPCVHADRRVTFRVAAPDAQKVQVRLGGPHDMAKGTDGLWMVTIPPQAVGFHYYSIVIDGSTVADPATRTFFGSGWANSATPMSTRRQSMRPAATFVIQCSTCCTAGAKTKRDGTGRDMWT